MAKMGEINKYQLFEELKPNQDFIKNIKLIYVFKNVPIFFGDESNKTNSIVVTYDDKTYVFGGNEYGVLGFGHMNEVKDLTLNKYLSGKQIIDFKNGQFHAIARTIDGKVYYWGWNYGGLLSNGRDNFEIYEPELNQYLSDKNIIDVCCGWRHSLVLTIGGQVYAWGSNIYGQIGIENNYAVSIPYHVNGFNGEKVKAIACGRWHSLALTEKGNVFSWGDKELGFKKLKIGDSRNAPKLIEISEVFEKIACGPQHSLLLSRRGDIYVFGRSNYGYLRDEAIKEVSEAPMKLKNKNKFIDIAARWDCIISMALSKDGIIFIWGENVINTPIKTQFKNFNEGYTHYLQITYKTIVFERKIENGRYSEEFFECNIIGSGSFGIVCKARNKKSNLFYAIKKIPFNEELKETIEKEIDTLTKLKSTFILKLESFWTEENYYKFNEHQDTGFTRIPGSSKPLLLHIQMKLCLFTLKEVMIKLNQELNQKQFMSPFYYYISSELLIEILESVDYLHKQNPPIIHKDLKPSNIMITNGLNGRFVKLADFGLAFIHEFMSQSHTGSVVTHDYMAPEVLRTTKFDTKADIYSLGMIVKELFDFTIDRQSDADIYSLLSKHYSKMIEIIDNMLSNNKNSRPNCDEIIRIRRFWALDLQQLKMLAPNYMSELKTSDKTFYANFIQIKLENEPNIKQAIPNISTETTTNFSQSLQNRKYENEFIELCMISMGGFGVVCKAWDLNQNGIFAIKKIPITYEEMNAKTVYNELSLLLKSKSIYVVQCYQVWIEKNYFIENSFIAQRNSDMSPEHQVYNPSKPLLLHVQMELCYKMLKEVIELLNQELNQKPLEMLSPLGYYISSELFIEILESVEYLHKQNIIHRDLKPTNILITDGANGRFIKIADFGLATIHEFDEQSHTKYIGTRVYTAPEVMLSKHYDSKADIYSLGIIAQELFNIDINRPSFSGINSTLRKQHTNISELIDKMMSNKAHMRPDCSEILKTRNLWALDLQQLKKLAQIQLNELKPTDKRFHATFIQTKLENEPTNSRGQNNFQKFLNFLK